MTLIRYFLIPKSRYLVSHNPGISGLKTVRDPGIAILITMKQIITAIIKQPT